MNKITNEALKPIMKRNHSIFFALAIAGAVMTASCNSSSEDSYEIDAADYGSVAIKSFSLKNNGGVLNNLDSVFFSIDLNNARIFNADSLPYGTDVSALQVSITSDECSAITIFSPVKESDEATAAEEEEKEFKEINYLEDDNVKINFSKGEVKMHVVSADGMHSRDYYLKVNVHTIVPDSLFWSEAAYTKLPSAFDNPIRQKTVKADDGKLYCYTSDGTGYNVAVSDDPFNNKWVNRRVTFPADVKLETLVFAGKYYVLAEDGELLSSADAFNWSRTGVYWHTIIGPYGPEGDCKVLGVKVENGRYMHTAYPSDGTPDRALAADFPVGGSSAVAEFATKWASKPQIVILGGRTSQGIATGATWAYDGTDWAKIGDGVPAGEGYALFKYKITETDTVSWRVKESQVLMAIGGSSPKGIDRNVYFSRDMGITWHVGSSLLQLPEYVPSVTYADALVVGTLMKANAEAGTASVTGWREMPVRSLPPVYGIPRSRAVSAIESWECPFIYMFGGIQENGTMQNAVWRGVINHFTFRPLE